MEVCDEANFYRRCEGRKGIPGFGWIEEVPTRVGLRQEATREELLETLRVTLAEALEFNRQEARGAAGKGYEELQIAV